MLRPTPAPILLRSPNEGRDPGPSQPKSAAVDASTNFTYLQRSIKSEQRAAFLQSRVEELERRLCEAHEVAARRLDTDPFYYVMPRTFLPDVLFNEHRDSVEVLVEYAIQFRESFRTDNQGRAKGPTDHSHAQQRLVKQLQTENAELRKMVATMLQRQRMQELE